MRSLVLGFGLVLAACSGDDPGDAGGGSSGAPEAACALRDDVSAGQYSDSCVSRSFIADYAGKYVSPTCTLEIDVSGSVPAVFRVTISGATLAGSHSVDWEGGAAGAGNDSYYRFTTDTTYTTTKALNFNAGKQLDGGGEAGRYAELRGGTEQDVDCGVYMRQ